MKYYKILNKYEYHNDLQYKTGLNEDILPFDPSGDCEPGGIYFSREDIFAFLDWGPWIREVTLPEGEPIYENPGLPKKFKAHRVILGEGRKIDLDVIKELISEGADPKASYSLALRCASENGHTEIVKLLIPVSDPKVFRSTALRLAASNGHIEIVKLLIPVSDPKASESSALRFAARNGYTEIVKLLIPISDPMSHNSKALRLAAYNGHIEIVKLLIPVSDHKVVKNLRLKL